TAGRGRPDVLHVGFERYYCDGDVRLGCKLVDQLPQGSHAGWLGDAGRHDRLDVSASAEGRALLRSRRIRDAHTSRFVDNEDDFDREASRIGNGGADSAFEGQPVIGISQLIGDRLYVNVAT